METWTIIYTQHPAVATARFLDLKVASYRNVGKGVGELIQ